MKIDYTARGFRIAVFKDRYGEACSIQESSSVTPSIWLGVCSERMHLSQKMVKDLLPLLAHFAEHGVLPDSVNRRKAREGSRQARPSRLIANR